MLLPLNIITIIIITLQESAAILNEDAEPQFLEKVDDEKELSQKTPDDNKSIVNQKSSEFPTDMSDTTESEENIQGIYLHF